MANRRPLRGAFIIPPPQGAVTDWQIEYDFVEPLQVPAGSTLKTVGHFDNSVNNRLNPSPDREVHWGDQSWDEMFTIFTTFSVDKNNLSLED